MCAGMYMVDKLTSTVSRLKLTAAVSRAYLWISPAVLWCNTKWFMSFQQARGCRRRAGDKRARVQLLQNLYANELLSDKRRCSQIDFFFLNSPAHFFLATGLIAMCVPCACLHQKQYTAVGGLTTTASGDCKGTTVLREPCALPTKTDTVERGMWVWKMLSTWLI